MTELEKCMTGEYYNCHDKIFLDIICDYGRNIYVGNNVSVNMNCTFVDCSKITIGDNVLIASEEICNV